MYTASFWQERLSRQDSLRQETHFYGLLADLNLIANVVCTVLSQIYLFQQIRRHTGFNHAYHSSPSRHEYQAPWLRRKTLALLCAPRALAARDVGEYVPWQVAGPILVKIKNLLTLDTTHSDCTEAFREYVLRNVTTPFIAGLSSDAAYGFK